MIEIVKYHVSSKTTLNFITSLYQKYKSLYLYIFIHTYIYIYIYIYVYNAKFIAETLCIFTVSSVITAMSNDCDPNSNLLYL